MLSGVGSRAALMSLCFGGACTEASVAVDGQLGRPISLLSGDTVPLPRFTIREDSCPGATGGCSAYCGADPQTCLQREPLPCRPLLVDTGSSLTSLASASEQVEIGETCFELRSGAGLAEEVADPTDLAHAVGRFRFLDAPAVSVPGSTPMGWGWQAGDELASGFVGGVLGGNTLRHFALQLRHAPGEPPVGSLFRVFPGDEPSLAAAGRAFVAVQYPRQLVGLVSQDRCTIGGISCELPGLDTNPDDERLIYESTRVVVDACVAPPPCAPRYDPSTETCVLSPGGTLGAESCPSAYEGPASGRTSSLLVATGIPDVVLFEDSAERMFGPVSALLPCRVGDESVELGVEDRACVDDGEGKLFVPGWAPLEGPLTRLRVRALALVPGLATVSGAAPCLRLQRRLVGLERQCEAYVADRVPLVPDAKRNVVLDEGLVVLGEVNWLDEQDHAESDRWIPVRIVPEDSDFAAALRRDVGSRPLELDGLIGTTLLEATELVVDYTEDTPGPGLRVTCLEPEAGRCLSVPSCTGSSPAFGEAEASEDAPKLDTACCFGLPQPLLRRVIRSGQDKPAPRLEEACCRALQRDGLEDLQGGEAGLCEGTDPM